MKHTLSDTDTNLLRFVQQHQQAVFSGILSTIAIDKLEYKVTDHTKFQLNADLTEMELSEIAEDSPVKAA